MADRTIDYADYKALLDRFLERLTARFDDDLVSLVLYGSIARGDAGSQSDVDLLIVLKEAPSSYRDRLGPFLPILEAMREEPAWRSLESTGIVPVISTLILSKEEADRNRLLYLDMLDDARILFDHDGFFQGRLRKLAGRLQELGSRKIQRNGGWYWDLKPGSKIGETVAL